jgi:hypothetical protein
MNREIEASPTTIGIDYSVVFNDSDIPRLRVQTPARWQHGH